MNIFAYTTLNNHYPPYISVSSAENGDATITVRGEHRAGLPDQHATITLPAAELERLALEILDFQQKEKTHVSVRR